MILFLFSLAIAAPGTSFCPPGSNERFIQKEEFQYQYCEKNRQNHGPYVFSTKNRVLQTGSFLHGLKNGLWRTFRPDGSLAREENFKHGKYHGLVKIFDHKKNLVEQLKYRNGLRHGESLHPASSLKNSYKATTFIDGRPSPKKVTHPYLIGSYQLTCPTGFELIKREWDYLDSYSCQFDKVKHGREWWVDENGRLKQEYLFQQGELKGPYSLFDDDGTIIENGVY